MISRTILLPICIVLAGFSRYTSAAFGDTCSDTTACTAADNTNCVQTSGCAYKSCSECKTGYTLTGGACKADIGTACTAVGDCAIAANIACTNNLCACTATNEALLGACVPTAKKFGATCTTLATDCEVVAAGNGDCSTTCGCASGYLQGTGHVCRKPYYGEACTNAVGCLSRGMTGEQTPTCPAAGGTCGCANTDEVTTYGGVSFCSTIVTNKLPNTITCTAHNECESGRCLTCPDTTGLICVGSNSPTIAVKPVLIVLVTLITGMLQL